MAEPLSPDTQATLLLCGRFGSSGGEAKPLAPGDYNRVAKWLVEHELRPADLLSKQTEDSLAGQDLGGVDGDRVRGLLRRGTSLAVALDRWGQVGVRVVGRTDKDYPARWAGSLRHRRPPLIFAVGEVGMLNGPDRALAIVGSRKPSAGSAAFVKDIATRCAAHYWTVVSGGAAGVDEVAMRTCLDAGGVSIGVLACKLERAATAAKWRPALRDGRLLLISEVSPSAPFSVGSAMSRNKLVYTLSDAALVANSSTKGGTWSGATENLKNDWVPLFVRNEPDAGEGIPLLVEKGARSLRDADLDGELSVARLLSGELRETSPAADLGLLESDEVEQAVHESTEPAPEVADDLVLAPEDAAAVLWGTFVSYLESRAEQRLAADEVAREFDVLPIQARAWMRRAAKEGLAERRVKPAVHFEVGSAMLLMLRADTTPGTDDAGLAAWRTFLGYLEPFVGTSRTADEVASELEITPKQAQKWLGQAVEAGRVQRKARPARFEVIAGTK